MKNMNSGQATNTMSTIYDHAKQYDNDGMCHNTTEWWKLHGNISRNGYGNAIIGRYGGCFEEGGLMHRRKLRDTRQASKGGRERVRIIHGLTLVIKNSHTYCKSLLVIKAKC